ncbi:BspA family leucine-rich repeat surface protein [Lactobacillus sp. W8092]|nr:BspA family leucine-rich repeat surface protein [Lactobacillus sp. W8092]
MKALKMKPRYIKIFIGLLLFYIGFLVINLQIVGQAAVPAVNKNMIGMQPRDTSEEKPEDLKYTITEKPLTGTTLEISGGQTINSPILNPGEKPTWPWYDKQGNPIKQLQDIKTIEVKKPLTIIGDMSEIFARMPKLENIVLDKGASVDTTGVTSFYRVFYQDSAIKSLDLSKIQGLSLDSAKNLSRVFEGDKSLESVTLSKNVVQVKDFSGLFKDCSSLTTINGIDSWKGSSATDVSNMFNGDTNLEKLDLAKFNPSPATNFSYMFAGCTALTSVGDLSQWTGSNAMDVSSMFNDDAKLEKLDLTKFNPSLATDFSYMFAGCTALSSVGDLSQWTGSNATNVSSMFNDDAKLEKLDLAKFNPSLATDFSYMFADCTALSSVGDLSQWIGSNATSVSHMFFQDSNLKKLDLSNFALKKVQFFSSMFQDCSELTTITGINSWDTSSAIYMDNMFNGDKGLTSLDLSKFNPNKVQNFSFMFNECSGLTTITGINLWDTSSAIFMNNMFKDDEKLTSLDLSDFKPNKVQYFSYMFYGCSGLTTITGINSWDVSSAIYMDHMFEGDTSFEGDKNLKSLTLNNANSENLQSVEGALNGCSQLARLDISKLNLTQANRTNFLAGCNNLWYLTLGKNSVLTNSSLPNAPDSDNPKGYPGDPENKKLICDSGTWIDKSEISDNSGTKKQYTSSDLCNLTLAGSKTFVWTPTAVTANLVGFPKNIKFNLMNTGIGTTVQGSDVQDPDNSFSVYDTTGHLKQNPVTTVSAKLISQSTNESDDNPVVFVGHNNHQLRKSQIQLAIGINNLNRLSGDVVLDTDFKPIIQYNPSSNNFKYTFNSQFKLSTYNSVVYLPDSYRATIEYQVIHSVK